MQAYSRSRFRDVTQVVSIMFWRKSGTTPAPETKPQTETISQPKPLPVAAQESNAMATEPKQPAQSEQSQRQSASLRYVDMPECTETFADSINGLFFDGQTLRIEFGITRMDEVKPNTPMTGRRYP